MSPRRVLSFARDLEFATEAELAKRMGCPRAFWLRAAVKELIDNALDAAEEIGRAPEIVVTIDADRLTVAHAGSGMPPELVERLCDRSERTSSREAYAAPDRGAQGNALQVLMALSLGFGRYQAVTTITSRGVEHLIVLRVNRLEGRIEVERIERPVPETSGTTVTLTWPGPIDLAEVLALVREHAAPNAHARLQLRDGTCVRWCSAGSARVAKWTPGKPTPIHWYSLDRFEHRVLLELRHDPAITVAQFVGRFAGLSDRSKRARIAEAAGLRYVRLDALLDRDETRLAAAPTQVLFEAMRSEAREPKPAVLGAVGKEWLEGWLTAARVEGVQRAAEGFAYRIIGGVDNGIPWRWEVAFAHLPGATERVLLVGQNFSPAIDPNAMLTGAVPWLPHHLRPAEPIALVAHRISPDRRTLDYGKSRLSLASGEASQLCEAIRKVAVKWIKLREREGRGHGTGERDLAAKPPRRISIRDAVWHELPAAYTRASSNGSHPVRARQVYYAIRPRVLELTGKGVLGDAYFSAQLLPEFLQEHPDQTAAWGILFAARGTLTEPHTGRTVPLGTAAVADYVRSWTNGIDPAKAWTLPEWAAETIGPRNAAPWDLAIVGDKGHATEAALALADQLCLPMFILHDFDRSGLVIWDNLKRGTWRHRYQNRFRVIDVGLRLRQVAELESEPIDHANLKSVGDDRLRAAGATAAEIKFLARRRVELNALTTAELVDLLEAALRAHGVRKVVPSGQDLANAWRAGQARLEVRKAIERANRRAGRWAKAPAPADLADRVARVLEGDPSASWDDALRRIAAEGAAL